MRYFRHMLLNQGTQTGGGAEFTIPDAYKGESSLQSIKSQDDLFKGFINAQKLIGSRPAGIPQDTAAPEEWDKFYNTLGRPEAPEKYEFEKIEIEGFKRDEALEKEVKTLMHKAGLTAKQAKLLQSEYDKLIGNQLKQQGELTKKEKEKADKEWEDSLKEIFGDKKDNAVNVAKNLAKEFANPKLKEHFDKLDDKSLLVLASVLNGVNDKYIKADGNPGAGGANNNAQQGLERARELMKSKAFNDPMDKKHEETVKEVNDLYNAHAKK